MTCSLSMNQGNQKVRTKLDTGLFLKTISRSVPLMLWFLIAAQPAFAHKLAPSLLSLLEVDQNHFQVSWKIPRYQPGGFYLQPYLPDICRKVSKPEQKLEGTSILTQWKIKCDADLTGQGFGVDGLSFTGTAALLRVEWKNKKIVQAILTEDKSRLLIKAEADDQSLAQNYLTLGVEHILKGLDHLLFVLGLILLAASRSALVWTITAFTLGHSVTLGLTALGYVSLPVDLIEFLIALSIFVVAVELVKNNGKSGWLRKRPWLAASTFGLLHGMGFAGALLEIGLPKDEVVWSLLLFNLGIEAGQLLFVAVALLFALVWQSSASMLNPQIKHALNWVPVYVIGSLSAFWMIERGILLAGH